MLPNVRTRFAPSPTGDLHLGGARTALFSWLFAKQHNGKFILRIEDTDTVRSTQKSTTGILESLQWLGLEWDEGPIYQSMRGERYQELAQKLLNQGRAYYCNCSPERLQNLRETCIANKQKPKYDGHCRHLNLNNSNQDCVIRFITPTDGTVSFEDKVCGLVTVANQELDDLIIQRSDGSPTYNFAVVVDDIDLQISHVIRGADHIANTSRQCHLFDALADARPNFCHIPLILAPNGNRLSKRDNAAGVLSYRDSGYLPAAVINYLLRLGWSYGDQEIFTPAEMLTHFSQERLQKSAATFNADKLQWYNSYYLQNTPLEIIQQHLTPFLNDASITGENTFTELSKELCAREKNLVAIANTIQTYYADITILAEDIKQHCPANFLTVLEKLSTLLQDMPIWHSDDLNAIIKNLVKVEQLKFAQLAQPLRVILTGSTASPSIDKTLFFIGKSRSIARIQQAISYLKT